MHIADSPFEKNPSKRLNNAIKDAASCVAISNLMAKHYQGIFKRNWEVIFSGSQIRRCNKVNNQNILNIRYLGILHERQHSNSIEDVIDAVEKYNLLQESKLNLEIYGCENPASWLSSKAKRRNVVFKGYFDGAKYNKLLEEADILLLPITFNKNALLSYRYSFPAKLSDYISSNKPILYYGSSETATKEALEEIESATLITTKSVKLLVESLKLITKQISNYKNEKLLSKKEIKSIVLNIN